jgi:hypothetical protein
MNDDAGAVPVYILGFALVAVLLIANVAIAADRTALDSEHAIETFGEEGVYSDVTEVVQKDTVERVNETIESEKEQRIEDRTGERTLTPREEEVMRRAVDERLPSRAQQEEFVERAITSEFVERELTRNLETVYAVLHGEQSDGRIAVRIDEQRDRLNQSIRETLKDEPRVDEEEIIAAVSGEIPDEKNLTAGGSVPSEVAGASAGVSLVGTLSWLLPLSALGLIGGVFHLTGRDPRRTVRSGGIGFVIAGTLSAAVGFGLGAVATGAAESALDADSAAVTSMSNGVVAVVDSLFGAILVQGLVLAGVGVLATGAVIAEQRGHLDGLLGSDKHSQRQRGQGDQQTQYSRYQQNKQGRYRGEQNQDQSQGRDQRQDSQQDQSRDQSGQDGDDAATQRKEQNDGQYDRNAGDSRRDQETNDRSEATDGSSTDAES